MVGKRKKRWTFIKWDQIFRTREGLPQEKRNKGRAKAIDLEKGKGGVWQSNTFTTKGGGGGRGEEKGNLKDGDFKRTRTWGGGKMSPGKVEFTQGGGTPLKRKGIRNE